MNNKPRDGPWWEGGWFYVMAAVTLFSVVLGFLTGVLVVTQWWL